MYQIQNKKVLILRFKNEKILNNNQVTTIKKGYNIIN